MSKHKGLPCQHTFYKGHKHATLFLLFFFAYAHAKRVRQVSCERVRTVPCACNHLIHCFTVEGHNLALILEKELALMDSWECLCRNSGTQMIEYYIDAYQRLYSSKTWVLFGEIPCRTSV